MITIDSVGKDGRPVLDGLQGASPAGGLVRSDSVPRAEIQAGHLVRDSGGWSVVLGTATDGVLGITALTLMRSDLSQRRATLYMADSAEVRTDARIDTWSLWKLADLAKRGAVSMVKTPSRAAETERAELGTRAALALALADDRADHEREARRRLACETFDYIARSERIAV